MQTSQTDHIYRAIVTSAFHAQQYSVIKFGTEATAPLHISLPSLNDTAVKFETRAQILLPISLQFSKFTSRRFETKVQALLSIRLSSSDETAIKFKTKPQDVTKRTSCAIHSGEFIQIVSPDRKMSILIDKTKVKDSFTQPNPDRKLGKALQVKNQLIFLQSCTKMQAGTYDGP